MSSAIRVLFILVSLFSVVAASTSHEPYKVVEKIPKGAVFVSREPVSMSLLLKFGALAELANLPYVSETRKLWPTVFDLMAASAKLDKVILLGTHRISDDFSERIYKVSKVIYAPITMESHPVSLIFVGFSANEVQNIFLKYKKIYPGRKPASETKVSVPTTQTKSVSPNLAWEYTYALGEVFEGCVFGIIDGFNAITVEPLKEFVLGSYSFVRDPNAFIEVSAEQAEAIKKNVVHFDKFARSYWDDWEEKTPQQKSHFYCSFYGGFGASKVLAKGVQQFTKASVLTAVVESEVSRSSPPAKLELKQKEAETPRAPPVLKAKPPQDLGDDALNLLHPDAPFRGRTWFLNAEGGSQSYPYLIDRESLVYLRDMLQKGAPNPTEITDPNLWKAAQALRDWGNGAQGKIAQALKGPDVAIDGKSYVLVNGSKTSLPRSSIATDFKSAPEIKSKGLSKQRYLANEPSFLSIRQTSRGGEFANSNKSIQGHEVKILYGKKIVEGTYLSSGGPGVPRGADFTQLNGAWQGEVKVHFLKVQKEVIMVPAKDAEIFTNF